jgi:hypothetical protein
MGLLSQHLYETRLEQSRGDLCGRDFWSMKAVLLAGNAGGLRARRVLAARIEQERSESTP